MDKVAGIPLGAGTAALTLYVALVGTVVLDGWLAPLHDGDADYLRRMMARVEGMPLESLREGVPWSWRSWEMSGHG